MSDYHQIPLDPGQNRLLPEHPLRNCLTDCPLRSRYAGSTVLPQASMQGSLPLSGVGHMQVPPSIFPHSIQPLSALHVVQRIPMSCLAATRDMPHM